MTERRLSAIAVADVAGYSAMMAKDEDGTLAALNAHLKAIDPIILNHGGRLFKATGDGFIVEFPSATGAVRAALQVQELMAERNLTLPHTRAMRFRIGINVGDVVHGDDGDVFGDAVIVAARLEPLSPHGGMAMSDGVARAVMGKVDAKLVDSGEHRLKNLPNPVRVWTTGGEPASTSHRRHDRRAAATVAVLPFDNMSGDPDQAYFADGLADDLITALTYERNIGVVARNLSFAFRGGAEDLRSVGRKLDATHIVEGGVRRSGDRVRITVQLIDVETGTHVWAERFDRRLEDVFVIQDEVVEAVASRLGASLQRGGLRRRKPSHVDAWDLTLEGMALYSRSTPESCLAAIEKFDEARALDSGFATPVARAAFAWMTLRFMGWRSADVNAWQRSIAMAEAAYEIDPDHPGALIAMSCTRSHSGRPDEALGYADRAVDANPYSPWNHHFRAFSLAVMGRHEEAIVSYSKAWRLGGHDPLRPVTANDIAWSHFFAGNPEAAVEWGLRSLRFGGWYLPTHLIMAASLATLGRAEEAASRVETALGLRPDLRSGRMVERLAFQSAHDRTAITDAWRTAGFPD